MSVRNGLVLVLAITALLFLAACGGSSSPTPVAPPSGGFTNSSFNGTYVFSSTGSDTSGALLAFAGALTADGNGHITGGTMDIVGPDVTPTSPIAQPITGGAYTVTADGRGQIKLGAVTFDFVLTSSSHGLITEFDGSGSGSGSIDLQSTVTLSQLGRSYAFSLAGADSSLNPTATAGSFSLDTTGDLTTGIQDFNDDGFAFVDLPISPSAVTLGTGSTPGSISLTTSEFNTLTFDVYPIDATHLKVIETDYVQFLAGDAFTQTGAAIPSGPMVFTVSGLDSNGPVAAGGLMTSDGTGNFSGGLEDVNDNGSISPAQLPFTGTSAAGGSVGGRVLVNLSGFDPAIQYVLYPIVGGVLMLETDSLGLTTGTAYAQTSQAVQTGQGYGLNLSAFNTSDEAEQDDIAEFTTSSGSLTGIVDINETDLPLNFDQALSGSYSVDSPATGRGEATTTEHNNGFVSFVFYVVNSSTVILVETDSNQIGSGTFELQSTPTGASAVVMHPAVSVVHPASRAHAAFHQRK